MVGHCDDTHILLCRDDSITCLDERLQRRDQMIRVCAVKTRRRLVYNVQRVPTLQLGSQFNALRSPESSVAG
ncbi:hypothetical protein GCM10023352_20060 [Rothia endophytica]|uniref:Uncharacterized protein n=1 Tax=Rothia endophytica TaxID=1324766 RepID=A0ABP9BSX3_9MICC